MYVKVPYVCVVQVVSVLRDSCASVVLCFIHMRTLVLLLSIRYGHQSSFRRSIATHTYVLYKKNSLAYVASVMACLFGFEIYT